MGAQQFSVSALGKTVDEAFQKAVEEAQYEHGHGGYTGTIAEKSDFVLATPPAGGKLKGVRFLKAVREALENVYDNELEKVPSELKPSIERWHKIYEDKWGPALAIEITGAEAKRIKEQRGRKGTRDKVFVFLGWASS